MDNMNTFRHWQGKCGKTKAVSGSGAKDTPRRGNHSRSEYWAEQQQGEEEEGKAFALTFASVEF